MSEFDDILGGYEPEADDPIVVELDAYVIAPGHRVWKTSAGKTHRFYKAVRDSNTVFPDVRGLADIPGHPSEWTDAQILAAIAADRWARELASRARGNKRQGSEGVSKQDRGVLTFAKRLWREAKKGDLVVVPADGWRENVLIGELLTDAGEVRTVEANDGDHVGPYVGRPVNWLIGVPKIELDEALIGALHTRAAVFTLGESQKEAVYRLAYSNFFYDGYFVSEFRTTKERFTAEDHAVVSTWLNAFDALRNSRDRFGDNREGTSFEALGLEKVPDDYAAEVKIDIQSPGEIFVRSAAPFALSLMAMFTLSACDSQQVVDNRVTVTLKHVGDPGNGVQQAVEDDVNSLRVALGQSRIEAQGSLAERAKVDALVTTKATLKSGAKKSK